MTDYSKLLTPFQLKHLTLKNRIMSSAHAPAYALDGMPQEQYQLYHEEKAKGGIALTMFGGSSTISPDCPASFGQLSVGEARIVPYFQQFSERIHRHGAKLMCQISHMGRRTRWDSGHWLPPVSASNRREPEHRSFPKPMEEWDFPRILDDYAKAALHCKEGHLDGVEVSGSGSHLISQFLAGHTNLRDDDYGGPIEQRTRFVLEVLQAIRSAVGPGFVVGIRLAGDEMVKGGLDAIECVQVAQAIADSGLVDFLNIAQGAAENYQTLINFIPNMKHGLAPFLYLAAGVRDRVDIPVFHAGRISDVETAAKIINEDHLDMVTMTRAHLTDPYIVRKLETNEPHRIRRCVGANYCIDRLYKGGQAFCIQNAASGREATMNHRHEKADERKTVVVIGGGPAGLEAARVSAERGHSVVLFEANEETGGQVNIAAKATWRAQLQEIVGWLDSEVRLLGVDVRTNTRATPDMVLAESPDYVVVATGGSPNKGYFDGSDLVVSTWDILNKVVPIGQNVLIYDDLSGHQAVSCAEVVAEHGSTVELVTPENAIGQELGGTNFATYMEHLHKQHVKITTNLRLLHVAEDGDSLNVVFEHEYSHLEESRQIDQIICEHGTVPNDDLYFALKSHSTNLGETDLTALIAVQSQTITHQPDGRFMLFRVGDAVTSRNIHAAIYDSLRLCSAF
ncbi:MAG: FAD-dependent oxidoreductase [Chloroflexota bacterium]